MILDDCLAQTMSLASLINKIEGQALDGKLSKTWKSLYSVSKGAKIDEICEGLERHKSSLLLAFARRNR
jgi:hypothetical protein